MSNIVKGSGLLYTTGVPNTIPSTAHDSEFAIDINGNQYAWNRTTSAWDNLGQGIEIATSSIAPTHVPSKFRPRFIITPTRELYFYSGSWGLVNPTAGGTSGPTGIYSGSGTVPDGTVAWLDVGGEFSINYTNGNPVLYTGDFDDGVTYIGSRNAFNQISVSNDEVSIGYTGPENFYLHFISSSKECIFTDNRTIPAGLQYVADYSTTISQNDRSIPDVGTVKLIARPYKVYTALLTQSGSAAPVATVLENTLSGTPVWSRDSEGYYIGTLAGSFPLNKTTYFIASWYMTNFTDRIFLYNNDINSFVVETNSGGIAIDDMLENVSIEIRVYP